MFCARNAAADDGDALPTWWHYNVADLVAAWTEWTDAPDTMRHVRRYAEEHQRRFGTLNESLQPLENLHTVLDEDSHSWRNLADGMRCRAVRHGIGMGGVCSIV